MKNTSQTPVRAPESSAKPSSLSVEAPASVMPEPTISEPGVAGSTSTSQVEDENTGIVKFKLYRPLKVNGEDVLELVLDFDGLGGDVFENVDDQLRTDQKSAPRSVVWSSTYCLYLGARAARMHINDIRRLSFRDQARIVNVVQNFFVNMGE